LCRKCLLKHVIEGKIKESTEMTGMRVRRCKQVLDGQGKDRILETERGGELAVEDTMDL
jgi:hypothetical protein